MRWRATAMATTVLLGTVLMAAPADAAPCGQPYLPASVNRSATAPAGASLDRWARVRAGAPDTDGDGRPDQVTIWHSPKLDEWRLEVRRGDGTVTFAERVPSGSDPDLPPGAFVFNRPSAWWGDADGDGRDDLLVSQIIRPPGELDQQVSLYLVPGTVAPGVHRPADVGVLLPGVIDADQVGDQDGDGGVDFAVSGEVVSGRAILAHGSGGALEPRPAPIRTLAAPLVGVLELGGPPTLVVAPPAPSKVLDLTLLGGPGVRLRSTGVPYPTGEPGLTVGAVRAGGHRLVWASIITRGGGAGWTWDLDAPCAPLIRTHTVLEGEWLWRIARVELGPGASATEVHRFADATYARNRAAIGPDPDRLRPGLVLVVP